MENDILEALLSVTLLAFATTTCSLLITCFIVHTYRRFLSNSSSSLSERENLRYDVDTMMVEEEEAPQGLHEFVINLIPSFIYNTTTKSEQETCSVCLTEFKDNDHVRTLPLCSHIFHHDCIDVWLRSNTNCPLCRSLICCHLCCLLTSIANKDGRVDFPVLPPYSFASERSL
ncbi:putative transcription factor C2H2 family [Medicago truncatula]|uniref:RING-type E3 ubiquitin transferase n=1 Tax=Medicago truncatula TaxID=3880 RepID=G7L1Y4_MEDTR|nr:RING-H2 finger protein ATL64 [Medicago truncatula]AES82682.1 zinc finger, C3HC4 type (RING finger) protein [Medicago truncatula]RHN49457.1 putative transcription factor C2H2 family [Medicago truncatula]